MLKKTSLFLILLAAIPVFFPAHALDKKTNKDAVTILDKIAPKADEKNNMVFAGQVKNNSEDLLHSVEIVFIIKDSEKKVLESITAAVFGKKEGILEVGEIGSFEAKSKVHISTAGSYEYNINWKTFANK